MVGDLPAGVAWQWRRWCMHPEYAAGAEGPAMRARFDAVKAPVTALSFTDDEMMSEASTRTLHAQFRGAPVTHVRLSPAALGLARVGHFGFFRREMREPLWRAHALRLLAAR
jgi:predicted alpha/beta hydrolase